MDAPSAEQDSICIRIKLLYAKNKTVTIIVFVLLILLLLGIIFLIVWFGILGKGKSTATASHLLALPTTVNTPAKPQNSNNNGASPLTAALLQIHQSLLLRNFQHP